MAKSQMKLAEALLLRSDMQKKLESIRSRIAEYAAVQKGDKPAEHPDKLMSAFNGLADDYADLVARINVTNLRAKIGDGRTMTRALADRDTLKLRHAALLAAVSGAKKQPDRYGAREIKWVAVVDVAKLQKQADDLASKLRTLNSMIQEANWKEELD